MVTKKLFPLYRDQRVEVTWELKDVSNEHVGHIACETYTADQAKKIWPKMFKIVKRPKIRVETTLTEDHQAEKDGTGNA